MYDAIIKHGDGVDVRLSGFVGPANGAYATITQQLAPPLRHRPALGHQVGDFQWSGAHTCQGARQRKSRQPLRISGFQ